jgi:hypothetical protein
LRILLESAAMNTSYGHGSRHANSKTNRSRTELFDFVRYSVQSNGRFMNYLMPPKKMELSATALLTCSLAACGGAPMAIDGNVPVTLPLAGLPSVTVKPGTSTTPTPTPTATLSVGPGKIYSTPCRALTVAGNGAVIEIDGSVAYSGDVCAFSANNLTIRGVHGRPKIDAAGMNA